MRREISPALAIVVVVIVAALVAAAVYLITSGKAGGDDPESMEFTDDPYAGQSTGGAQATPNEGGGVAPGRGQR